LSTEAFPEPLIPVMMTSSGEDCLVRDDFLPAGFTVLGPWLDAR
jgi:hypothetical protein